MSENVFSHKSVLLDECIEALDIHGDRTYIDCTTGGGGHSLEIAKRLGNSGRLICFDRDTDALTAAGKRLSDYSDKVTFVHDNYGNISQVIGELGITNLGGVLADLGCSSYQFDTPERGFSYMHDAPLDMRMDETAELDAYRVVNEYSEEDIKRILYDYGEERFAPRIARKITESRAVVPIKTTGELSDIICSAIPAAAKGDGHPAKRSFQAIRIEVNAELGSIAPMIEGAVNHLIPGGRTVIISFHSLEDRIVKETYKNLAEGCVCPRDFPVCVCNRKPKIRILTKKPILPSPEEQITNPRSRSAKLRVAEKL